MPNEQLRDALDSRSHFTRPTANLDQAGGGAGRGPSGRRTLSGATAGGLVGGLSGSARGGMSAQEARTGRNRGVSVQVSRASILSPLSSSPRFHPLPAFIPCISIHSPLVIPSSSFVSSFNHPRPPLPSAPSAHLHPFPHYPPPTSAHFLITLRPPPSISSLPSAHLHPFPHYPPPTSTTRSTITSRMLFCKEHTPLGSRLTSRTNTQGGCFALRCRITMAVGLWMWLRRGATRSVNGTTP
jgi:hypothetical protein